MAMSLDLGELQKRLKREKAQTGDMQASLIWNDPSDLDLWCEVETGPKKKETIYYGNKKAAGGYLDVDMNVQTSGKRFSLHPVENIFWKTPVGGKYSIFVRNASTHTDIKKWPAFKNPKRSIPFKVYLTKDGKTQAKSASIKNGQSKVDCFKFSIKGSGSSTGGGGSFVVFPAGDKQMTFKDLCSKYKVTWEVGCGYYAVVRSEKIHNGKAMLLQNLSTNKFTVGRAACLKALSWPDSELKKGPKDLPANTMLFVQSTSYNRVIPAGTPVLFEVSPAEHARHQKINAKALKEAQQKAKTVAAGGGAGKDAKAKAEARVAQGKAKAKGKAQAKVQAKAKAKAGAKRAASPSPSAPAPKRAAGGGGGSVSGKAIVFTGTLTTPRAASTAAAKAAGANVQSGVSKNTDILVAGPGAGSKATKAAALGVAVWDEAKFKKAVGL